MHKHDFLDKASKEFGNSFYILNGSNYLKNITDIKNAFQKYYDNIIIGYSYKTNYIPELCMIAKENGVYAEVVSDMELDLAYRIGYKSDKIIFNGPLKKEKDLEKILLGDGIVNIDSFYEIDLLKRIVSRNPGVNISVGIRINMSLVNKDGISAIQEGLKYGRFGFEESEENLGRAVKLLENLGININALHGHTSSSDRSIENFKVITRTLCRVRKKYNLNNIKYLNVGGGFFGPIPKGLLNRETPTFSQYAKSIVGELQKDDWFITNKPYLILEPGVSVVSNAMSYVAKIIDIKQIMTKNFMLIEGGVYNVMPTMHGLNLPFDVVTKSKDNTCHTYDIVGSTCMEKDIVLSDVKIENVKRGDFLIIENVGAYTIVKTPEFINYIPAILTVRDNKIKVIRHKQNLSNILEPYNLNT